jgi:hypothetical protein
MPVRVVLLLERLRLRFLSLFRVILLRSNSIVWLLVRRLVPLIGSVVIS